MLLQNNFDPVVQVEEEFSARAFFKAQLRNMYACAKHKIAFLRLACQKKVFFMLSREPQRKRLALPCDSVSLLMALKKDVLCAGDHPLIT